MEIYSHPDNLEILSLPGNSTCCDCGIEKPKWASLNNSAFLCLKCAGIHRSLGIDISTILLCKLIDGQINKFYI